MQNYVYGIQCNEQNTWYTVQSGTLKYHKILAAFSFIKLVNRSTKKKCQSQYHKTFQTLYIRMVWQTEMKKKDTFVKSHLYCINS